MKNRNIKKPSRVPSGIPLIAAAFVIHAVLGASPARAAEYAIDSAHSHVGFTVRHLFSKVPGEFKSYDGTFSFDPAKPETAKVKVSIQAASIDTGNPKRDEHLKSPDFFDVKKHGSLGFVSRRLVADGEKKYKLEGDLTIHGVTRPATFDVEFLGADKDPWGGRRAGFTASTKVNRKDFGLLWNKTLESGGLLVGEDVEISLQVEALEKAAK